MMVKSYKTESPKKLQMFLFYFSVRRSALAATAAYFTVATAAGVCASQGGQH
jgi:hypothetical protein